MYTPVHLITKTPLAWASCLRALVVVVAVLGLAGCQTTPPGAGSHADSPPRTTQKWPFQFATLEDAVWFAAVRTLEVSRREDREYGGAILQHDDGYFWLTLGSAAASADALDLSVQVPRSSRAVAFWHTHGAAGPNRVWFSAADAALAQRTGLPFYLVTPDGELKVVHPDRTGGRVSVRQSVARDRALRGVHVGWVRPEHLVLALRPTAAAG